MAANFGRPRIDLVRGQRKTDPVAHRLRDDAVRLVEEHHAVLRRPARHGPAPVFGEQVGEAPERVLSHQRQEHRLAVAMGLAVHHHHAAMVLDQREGGGRQRVAAGEAVMVVEA
ncbi:hypothetical protein [Methylobacterium sp.]|uniref:hypothetical protein n=1 Tax=Methylobacterium sp. TaxID=409 RepID=UPI003B5B2660